MAQNFRIVLDSPGSSYYAGTTVTGRVICNFDKPKKARGLKIKFDGEASVSWTDTENHKKPDGETERRTINYHAEEEYFSNKYYLVGSANGDIEIPPGEKIYPFSTTLPPQLPTSFDGERGHVRYSVKATLDRPWKTDYEAKTNFTVITPVDLNYIALAKEQVKIEKEKNFCCCCCKSGPFTMVVWIPHKGYVPGQNINVTVELDNASSVDIENIDFKLKKIIKWTVRNPKYDTKYDTIELLKLHIKGVEAGKSSTLTQSMTFPQMPFINLDACSIIDVSFVLKVNAQAGGCYGDLDAEIPLMLGTVPIQEGGAPMSAIPQNQEQTTVSQQNFAPPPYQESPYPFNPSSQPYPGTAVPYPNPTPYPGAPSAAPYPGAPSTAPYPGAPSTAPYPGAPSIAPYPGAPYPSGGFPPPYNAFPDPNPPGFVAPFETKPPYPVPAVHTPYSNNGTPTVSSPSAPLLEPSSPTEPTKF